MKKIFVTFIALFCVIALNAQDPEKQGSFVLDNDGKLTETNSPVMEFEEEKYDFGEVEEGPKISHDFVLVNAGKEPLVIKNVKASCGCTATNWPKEPIMPGEEAKITATYNTKGRVGPFNKSLTITSNAYTPTKRLFIKGKVLGDPNKTPAKTKRPPVKKQEVSPVMLKSTTPSPVMQELPARRSGNN